jgi:hypothetical protein
MNLTTGGTAETVGFRPYSANMLVQPGTKVLLKNMGEEKAVQFFQVNPRGATGCPLQSKGIKLNWRRGTAIEFFALTGIWTVELEEDDAAAAAEKQKGCFIVSVPITHLELDLKDSSCAILFGVVHRCGLVNWAEATSGGTMLLQAGTLQGKKAMILCDDPNDNELFDPAPIYAQIQYMGIPRVYMDDLLQGYKKLSRENKNNNVKDGRSSLPSEKPRNHPDPR